MCLVPKAGDREEGQAQQAVCYKAGGKTGELELEVGKESEDLLSISLVSVARGFLGRDQLGSDVDRRM